MADALQILLPPGRIIMGDVNKGSDKDSKGVPRTVKSGPNKGQQVTQYFIGVAIPKAGEQAWWQTAWGQQIMAVGQQGFPNFFQNPAFAWKIEDGDSTVPNKSNRRMCDAEGAPGHHFPRVRTGRCAHRRCAARRTAARLACDSAGSGRLEDATRQPAGS